MGVETAVEIALRVCPSLVLQIPCCPEKRQGTYKHHDCMRVGGSFQSLSHTKALSLTGPGYMVGVRTVLPLRSPVVGQKT